MASDNRLDWNALRHNDDAGYAVPLLVTRQEAARLLSLSIREVDNLRRAGRLLAKRHGTKVLFPVAELERYADMLPWEVDLGTEP
jgi:excisionase family DNA binding protein